MDRQTAAYHDFLFGAKRLTNTKLLPQATAHYEQRVADTRAQPRTADDAGALVANDLAYETFAWFEHYVQRMKYEGPRGVVQEVRGHADEFLREFDMPASQRRGTLDLDPNLELPAYYRQTEFHLQPGGVWSDDLSACIYEQVALTVFPGLNENQQIHTVFTQGLERADYRRILDIGCGYAKSALPFVDRYPDAEVFGIDLSAPVLKLGHQKAEASGRRLLLSQQNGEHTSFPDKMFDLVTATMVIHEIPPLHLAKLLIESYRLLQPGGDAIFLDFYRTGDPWRDFIMDGHSERNNEPFMKTLFRMDLEEVAHAAGFESVEIQPFDERTGAVRQHMRPEWHFPWALIRLRK